jgi:hypothetical protein
LARKVNGLGLLERISMMSGSLKIIVFGTLLDMIFCCWGAFISNENCALMMEPRKRVSSGQCPDSFTLLLDPIFDEKESCW